MQSSRNYVFTLNNPTLSEIRNLHTLVYTGSTIKFLIFQGERGANGTSHLQGYLELRGTHRIEKVKGLLGTERVHLERRRGSQKDAIDYCKKDDSRDNSIAAPFISGEPSQKGQRSDLKDMICDIKKKVKKSYLYDNYPGNMLRYTKGINEAIRYYAPLTRSKPEVIVIWGDPGVGKTRYVVDQHKPEDIYWLGESNSGVWWDGYESQEVVLIDDFYGWIKWHSLLRLLDRNSLQGDIKGGFVKLNYIKKIYFTSNVPPLKWYNWEKSPHMKYKALRRRISKIYHMSVDNCYQGYEGVEDARVLYEIDGNEANIANKKLTKKNYNPGEGGGHET